MSLAVNATSRIIPCLRYRNALRMIDWLWFGSCDPWVDQAAKDKASA
jgi:hypothetical protein